MLRKIIGGISSEAIGKIADATGKAADAYAEAQRLRHEQELEEQIIEAEKRKARRPVMIVLIILCVIAIAYVWIKPAEALILPVLLTIVLLPLLIFFITRL